MGMKKINAGRMRKDRGPDFLYLMGDNGWTWQTYDGWADDEFFKYKAVFLASYRVEVCAVVSDNSNHIRTNGHLGVMWLEATGYPDCDRDENYGYSFTDLDDILTGMILAEENLVRCSIPFVPDYQFHGPNRANMKRRNEATRKKLNMEHWEEIAWDEANKK